MGIKTQTAYFSQTDHNTLKNLPTTWGLRPNSSTLFFRACTL